VHGDGEDHRGIDLTREKLKDTADTVKISDVLPIGRELPRAIEDHEIDPAGRAR